jgi:hypothetical protein
MRRASPSRTGLAVEGRPRLKAEVIAPSNGSGENDLRLIQSSFSFTPLGPSGVPDPRVWARTSSNAAAATGLLW